MRAIPPSDEEPTTVRLTWPDKDCEQAVPRGVLSRVEQGSDQVRIVHGDNASALSALAQELAGQVSLAYLDPPFFTGRAHEKISRSRDPQTGRIVRANSPAFDDTWVDLPAYLNTLGTRLRQIRHTLCNDGCVVVHVDTRTSHYVKILCDEIFGEEAFASEIIWRYRRWPSKTKNFQRVHDTLLRYVRDPAVPPRFVQQFEPLAESTLRIWGTNKQQAVFDRDGTRRRSSSLEERSPGVPLGDVWEIGIIAPISKERTGYPTQKPEALLKRLVLSCTHPGDLVLDPYCGSGTTLVAAAKLERRAIGIDDSASAIDVVLNRFKALTIQPTYDRCVAEKVRPSARRHHGSR